MQPITTYKWPTPSRWHCLLLAIVLMCIGGAKPLFGQKNSVVEITETDLFGIHHWQDKQVSIDGFLLGMTRPQARLIADAKHLKLVTELPKTVGDTNGVCREDESTCAIYKNDGPWIGVNLFFDANGEIGAIRIGIPVDAESYVKKVNIARTFKGLTYTFFHQYSDVLRQRIFGSVEPRIRPRTTIPGDQENIMEYDYSAQGAIVRVTVDKRDHPPQPYDLEVDFVNKR